MFSLSDSNSIKITFDDILERVSEESLWRHYCSNFNKINKSFKSELYDDRTPSCRIYINKSGRLLYHDFGDGVTYGIMDYIKTKYNCTYAEAVNIVTNDFNLRKLNVIFDKKFIKKNVEESLLIKPKVQIEVLKKPFDIIDYNYWSKFGISLDILDFYNVFSCSEVRLMKDDKIITIQASKSDPIYAYMFITSIGVSYKIYRPFSKEKRYKWIFNGNKDVIEGFDQLDWISDLLIITKSLKDCMVYRKLGYNAISLQGETNKLEQDLVLKLNKRFKSIVINYDNDKEGIKNTKKICKAYNLKHFFIDDYKDISDYISNTTFNEGRELIINKINKLNDE